MKKDRVVLSSGVFLALILMIFGSILIVKGMSARIHINNCKALDDVEMGELRSGEYVCGTIESLLGKESSFADTHKLYPFCNTDVWSGEETYMMRINKMKPDYIGVKVSSGFLDDFKKSIGTDLSSTYLLYGKVKKAPDYDREMIQEYENLKGNSDSIQDNYIIQVVDFNTEKEKLYQGIIVFLSGFFLMPVFVKRIRVTQECAEATGKEM